MANKKELSANTSKELRSLIAQNLDHSMVAGEDLIPTAAPVLSVDDIMLGVNSLLGGWLTEDEVCNQFEKKLKHYIGSKFTVLTNSGSSANLLAISALTSSKLGDRALKKGDEVITVAAGFPTTVNPIIQNGLIPVFVDIEIPSYNIKAEEVEAAITDKTKAIVLAHSLGNPFNLGIIKALADKYNLWLIEDNCDALGATYDDKMTGSFGDLSTSSFFPAHQITTGEGGAVLINNAELKRIVLSFRNWGRDCWCLAGEDNTCGKRFIQQHGELPFGYDHKYVFSHIGYNLKMTEAQAAIGLSQMDRLHEFVEARRKNHGYLNQLFADLEDFFVLPKAAADTNPSWFGYQLMCRDGLDRNALINELSQKKIGTRLFFAGNIIKQPAYKDIAYRVHGELENTDKAMDNCFWLSVWPGLEQSHLDYMFDTVKGFVKK